MAPPGDYSAEKAAQIARDLAAAKKAYIDLGAAAVNFGNISSDVADKELINAKNLAQQNGRWHGNWKGPRNRIRRIR